MDKVGTKVKIPEVKKPYKLLQKLNATLTALGEAIKEMEIEGIEDEQERLVRSLGYVRDFKKENEK